MTIVIDRSAAWEFVFWVLVAIAFVQTVAALDHWGNSISLRRNKRRIEAEKAAREAAGETIE